MLLLNAERTVRLALDSGGRMARRMGKKKFLFSSPFGIDRITPLSRVRGLTHQLTPVLRLLLVPVFHRSLESIRINSGIDDVSAISNAVKQGFA